MTLWGFSTADPEWMPTIVDVRLALRLSPYAQRVNMDIRLVRNLPETRRLFPDAPATYGLR